MLQIRLQGLEYLFIGDSIDDGGVITTDEAFRNGTLSCAYLYADGDIMRFGKKIGERADIEVLGPASVEPFDIPNVIFKS